MREIKFKYIIIREKEEMISKAFSIIDIEFGYMNRWYAANHIGADELKRCQYTGLKDKNGKEIYEGDLLQLITFEGDGEILAYPVEYEDGCFGIRTNGEYLAELKYYIDMSFVEAEIIGNIYENPEFAEPC